MNEGTINPVIVNNATQCKPIRSSGSDSSSHDRHWEDPGILAPSSQ